MKSRFHSDNGLKTDANGPLEQNFTIKKECQTCHEHVHVRERDMSSKLAVPAKTTRWQRPFGSPVIYLRYMYYMDYSCD